MSKMLKYTVVPCPSTELSHLNRAIINPYDDFAQIEHVAIRYPNKNEAFVFSVQTDRAVAKGDIAFNLSGRKWASLMVKSQIEAAPYQFQPTSQCLNAITFYTDFASRQNAPVEEDFDTDEMAKQFSQRFANQAFTVGQLFGFAFQHKSRNVIFELRVKELEAVNVESNQSDVGTTNVEIGLTTANTLVMFEPAEGAEVKLIGGKTGQVNAPKLFSQDWDFETMGVGGLSEEFNTIFRRAFASRLVPPHFAKSVGFKHVRGMLLYGPPGTGKTLIARQIGKMLFAREPKIINGPEVLSKFVGESEANIRKLFADAEEEQAKAGINSGLHVIIFDEIDSICKSRGSAANTSGVGDNVVNQLLSKIDGVHALNNVLLIGMTNRKELIDEALLRPGRLEVHVEIGLPNKQGRLEIFKIHTKDLRDSGRLDPALHLEELAECTKNYTGAEIAGLVEAARSFALSRATEGSKGTINQEMLDRFLVIRSDFQHAMEHDIKPALGVSEGELKALARPIIQWDREISALQSKLSLVVRMAQRVTNELGRPHFLLIMGEPGVGSTTLAANMALETGFPFCRVYEADSMSEKLESARVQYMAKLFEDAARSEASCIVMDDLELIMDYVPIGPSFSKILRNVFYKKKDRILSKGHRMLVVCTCKSKNFLEELQLKKMFDTVIRVPALNRPEQVETVLKILEETGGLSPFAKLSKELIESLGSIPFHMGIKDLERLIKYANEDEPSQRVKMFLERMHELDLVVRPSKLDQFAF